MLVMSEQIQELQNMEDLVKQEKEQVNKWNWYYKDLEIKHSRMLEESTSHWERANTAKTQVNEMA